MESFIWHYYIDAFRRRVLTRQTINKYHSGYTARYIPYAKVTILHWRIENWNLLRLLIVPGQVSLLSRTEILRSVPTFLEKVGEARSGTCLAWFLIGHQRSNWLCSCHQCLFYFPCYSSFPQYSFHCPSSALHFGGPHLPWQPFVVVCTTLCQNSKGAHRRTRDLEKANQHFVWYQTENVLYKSFLGHPYCHY